MKKFKIEIDVNCLENDMDAATLELHIISLLDSSPILKEGCAAAFEKDDDMPHSNSLAEIEELAEQIGIDPYEQGRADGRVEILEENIKRLNTVTMESVVEALNPYRANWMRHGK